MSTAEALSGHELALWDRLLRPDQGDLTPEAARFLLSLKFDPADLARLRELSDRNKSGELTIEQRVELEGFLRVGLQLDLLRARALRSLRNAGETVPEA
jgi:hypothetical protein